MSGRQDGLHYVRALARQCADDGLRIADARALFDQVYRAHALKLSSGNHSRAAKIMGVRRERVSKMSRGLRASGPDWGDT